MKNRTYFFILLFFYTSVILTAFFLNVVGNFVIGDKLLLNYQLDKINNEKKKVKTIFVGDSSLGHAINASIIESITGKKTLNLALNANVSYSGSFGMLENYKFDNLENIYILSSLDSWRKTLDSSVYDRITSNKNLLEKYKWILKSNFNYKVFYQTLTFAVFSEKYPAISDDYLERSNRKIKIDEFKKINENKIKYLKKIFNYCFEEKINCKFYHTPIVEYHCQNSISKKYISNVFNLLEKNKINYSKTLFCYDNNSFTDSMDHLSEKQKIKFSNFFAKDIIGSN